MKRILSKISLLVVAVTFFSCNDLLDINEDPNVASIAPPAAMMAAVQARLGVMVDQGFSSTAFLWAQYWTWGPGVSLGPTDKHEYAATSSNGEWRDSYARALLDAQYVAGNANPSMGAVANLLSAYNYGLLVDHFDAVPYSEALKGTEIPAPAFEAGADIYADLLTKIDGAIAALEANAGLDDIEGDMIYGGDVDSWVRFGNSLKLKLLMRMSENGGPADLGAQVTALITSGNFITSNSDNAELPWAGMAGSENPMYANMESGLGNFYIMSQTALNILDDLGDPRIDILYDTPANGGPHVAVDQGDILNVGGQTADFSTPSTNVYFSARPTLFMSATEVLFYLAEAAERYGTGDPVALFGDAVQASFDYHGAGSAAAYVGTLNYATSPNRLRELAIQMWVACNGVQMMEGWIATRKFDNASRPIFASAGGQFISPATNSLGDGVFPSILLYPQNAVDLNASFPGQHLLTGKVFWDN